MKKKFKSKSTNEICEMVTNIVIEGLEKGICPWIKPWASAEIGGVPKNYNYKSEYNGSNQLILTTIKVAKNYSTNFWVTYKGARALDGNVKKGEKGSPVVYWNFIKYDADGNRIPKGNPNNVEVAKSIPFLKYFSVFNLDQCEGIEMPEIKKPKKVSELKVLKDAQAIVDGYDKNEKSLDIKIQDSDRAYYNPSDDMIVTPTMRQAVEKAKSVGQSVNDGKQHFYSTMFHEMIHSTGHKSRLSRDGITDMNFFGSHEYSKEELVAEIGSAILCFKAGLTSERVMDNTSAYCKSWAKKLKSDPKWIVWAGGRATTGAKYVLNGK